METGKEQKEAIRYDDSFIQTCNPDCLNSKEYSRRLELISSNSKKNGFGNGGICFSEGQYFSNNK